MMKNWTLINVMKYWLENDQKTVVNEAKMR